MKLGIDIGSTTIKFALIENNKDILYTSYKRHFSKINENLIIGLEELKNKFPEIKNITIAITGSAGLGIAENIGISFTQEVFATKVATGELSPSTDVVIELGGEDAKILFLTNGLEVRMNGTCAGGTGAFIDQIASLLSITPEDMNNLAENAQIHYTIASRCGVFAKSDLQPLLNQGAKKEDLSASVFKSVVNQTITGLAQGREIQGNILYLGGPLTFMSKLRESFDDSLNVVGICPDNSLYYVAIGCAICAETSFNIDELINELNTCKSPTDMEVIEPLFKNDEDYQEFLERHKKSHVETFEKTDFTGNVHIGIDAGSTTIKVVAIDDDENIIFSSYQTNGGNPIPPIKSILEEFYSKNPDAHISSSSVTGYGEDMIKKAFNIDFGLVETIAHYTGAKKFNNNVDFVIDIGGQDMKCFKIENGVIDDIYLNEACSAGCGSFLQTFANILGYSVEEYAKIGLFADAPVDLGSRCTVFMNSSVKQAQKDGATPANISAGLSMSVVKNAIYKLLRASSQDLGENIVVQGGTFLNDAVLRSFEKELNTQVIRPNIAGIMGAYGSALYGKNKGLEKSTLITNLSNFTQKISQATCKLCSNQCALTINTFDDRRFIAGNRCEKPTMQNKDFDNKLNLFAYKRELLQEYMTTTVEKPIATIGIPFVLNMYDLLPFWSVFFGELGFNVIASGFSDTETYANGQHTIPSDTVCFPAKLVHGHIEKLLKEDIDAIFYPCMTYNINENRGDNHFNCPVVAYYPETVASNISEIRNIKFIYDYIGIHRPTDFTDKMHKILSSNFKSLSKKAVKNAVEKAFLERDIFLEKIRDKGVDIIINARKEKKEIVVLAGRPYHLDPKVNHNIDGLITSYDVAVISEDAICHLFTEDRKVNVLNQWTYHSRLYDSAKYMHDDMHFIQLVSFGCGIDSITTDEIRTILQKNNKIYTQLKIDEISNLGATKIRIRSLLSAIEQKRGL